VCGEYYRNVTTKLRCGVERTQWISNVRKNVGGFWNVAMNAPIHVHLAPLLEIILMVLGITLHVNDHAIETSRPVLIDVTVNVTRALMQIVVPVKRNVSFVVFMEHVVGNAVNFVFPVLSLVHGAANTWDSVKCRVEHLVIDFPVINAVQLYSNADISVLRFAAKNVLPVVFLITAKQAN
jgi:hypothetical protein